MSQYEFQPDPERDEDENLNAQPQEDTAADTAEQRLGIPEAATAEHAERLRYVEDLLRNAPLIAVPVGFAERVVAALRGKDSDDPDYRDAMGIVIGLLVSILITLAVLGLPAFYIITAVLTGDAATVLADVTGFLGMFVGWLGDLPAVLLPAAVAAVIGVVLLSGYVVWFVRGLLTSTSDQG
jgi:hypothetical protein